MLLNTSFNLFGEPLVLTPRDAMRSYFGSGLDAHSLWDTLALSKVDAYAATNPPVVSRMGLRA